MYKDIKDPPGSSLGTKKKIKVKIKTKLYHTQNRLKDVTFSRKRNCTIHKIGLRMLHFPEFKSQI